MCVWVGGWGFTGQTLAGVLPKVAKDMATIGSLMHEVLPQEIRDEITGCSTAMGTSVGWATLLNVGYEVSDACTSIVAALPDGTVLHGRNLDFWAGMGFTNTLKELAFEANIMKGGKLLYKSTTFAGYVGVLSGMKPGVCPTSNSPHPHPSWCWCVWAAEYLCCS